MRKLQFIKYNSIQDCIASLEKRLFRCKIVFLATISDRALELIFKTRYEPDEFKHETYLFTNPTLKTIISIQSKIIFSLILYNKNQ